MKYKTYAISGNFVTVSEDEIQPIEYDAVFEINEIEAEIIKSGGTVSFSEGRLIITPLAPIVIGPIQSASRIITQEMFTRKLTQDELRTIYTVAKTNIDLEIWLDRFKMAKEIDLDDPFMIKGLNNLEAFGLLATGRSSEILG